MAKIVQTTDEKILKAAKNFPKAEGLLKDLITFMLFSLEMVQVV